MPLENVLFGAPFRLVIVFIRHCSLMRNNVKNNNHLLIDLTLVRNMKQVGRDVWHKKNCIASIYYSQKISSLRTEGKKLIYNQRKYYL